jgi:hypothetical protein
MERLANRVSSTLARRQLESEFASLMRTVPARGDGAGLRVGVATFGSGGWHFVLEALLAHALAARGAQPQFLVCDMPDLPICDERTIDSRHREQCDGCINEKRPLLDVCGLPWHGLSAFVAAESLARARAVSAGLTSEELSRYVERGFPIGQWLHVSACHYLRCDAQGESADRIDTRRRLLATAIVTVEAVERWLEQTRPEVVIAESGAHLVWRIAVELARRRGIPVVCREIGKGGFDTHIYSLNADCMAPDLSGAWDEAKAQALTQDEEASVDRFLEDIPQQTYVQRAPIVRSSPSALRSSLGVAADARVAVAFTNVTWDLATAGRDRAFTRQLDWLGETIRTVASTAARLIIRTHPAEASLMTRERVADVLARDWPDLSRHVTVIGSADTTAARDFCSIADLVLAYNSHVAIEAAAMGKAVVVAGDPHFRGRGFTIDIDSRTEYHGLLREWAGGRPLVAPVDSAVLAKRYCHLFFLRYHVTMNWTTSPLEPPYQLRIRSVNELAPGRNPAVDAVCDSILNQYQMVLPRAVGGRA